MRSLLWFLLVTQLFFSVIAINPNVRPPIHLLSTRSSSNSPDDSGWGPPDVLDLYSWSTSPSAGAGKVIALIGAFHSPTVEADLAVFSTFYDLPACTIANGCLIQVDIYGRTSPVPETGDIIWQTEAALDVQWVHAMAPGATIMLVQTWDLGYSNFTTAIQYGAAHADVLSASWLYTENEQQLVFDELLASLSPFPLFAPAGDNGPGVFWPSSSPSVIGVGGTTFNLVDNQLTEECWVSSGGGCSIFETSPSVQRNNRAWRNSDAPSLCDGFRSVPDCSSLSFPVWIYFSPGCAAAPNCWYLSGGTSLSAPLVASRSAVVDVQLTVQSLYTNSKLNFLDIVLGEAISQTYVNQSNPATPGYDLCTGLGSFLGLTGSTTTTTATTTKSTTDGSGAGSTSKSSGCFAADSLVRVRLPDSQAIVIRRLSDLRVNDLVESFDPRTLHRYFSPVYFVAHRNDKAAAELVELTFRYPGEQQTRTGSIKATPNHLLLSSARGDQAPELKPARDIKIGEYIFVTEPDGEHLLPTRVDRIQQTTGLVLNPLTRSDRIVVADVAASVFVESAALYELATRPLKWATIYAPSLLNENSWFISILDFVVSLTDSLEANAPFLFNSFSSST